MRLREHTPQQLEAPPIVSRKAIEDAWLRARRPLVWVPPPAVKQICAAPTFQGLGTAASGIGDVVPAWPAGHQANDIALLFCESDGGEAVATPSGGWAAVGSPVINGTATRLTVFWFRATGSSETNPTVVDPGNHCYARIATFRGCITTGNPWDVIGADGISGGTTTSVTIPGVTTTVAETLVVCALAWASDSAGPLITSYTNGALSGLAEQADEGSTAGSGGGISFAVGEKTAAGATGDTAAVTSLALNYACLHIALKPPTPGIVGTLGTSIGNVALAATGALAIAGVLSKSIGAITLSAQGEGEPLVTPPELFDPVPGHIGLR
jgi:hypothetical protein